MEISTEPKKLVTETQEDLSKFMRGMLPFIFLDKGMLPFHRNRDEGWEVQQRQAQQQKREQWQKHVQ
jgi:hypothetical protein